MSASSASSAPAAAPGLACLSGCAAARAGSAFSRRRSRLARQGPVGSCFTPFFFQCLRAGARAAGRGLSPRMALPFFVITGSLLPCAGRCLSAPRWLQLHTGAPGLGKTNSDRLLGRSRAVLSFTDVVHLLAHEFAGLGARRFAFTRIFARAFQRLFFGHIDLLTARLVPCWNRLHQTFSVDIRGGSL